MGNMDKLKLFSSNSHELSHSRGQQSSEAILILGGILLVGLVIGAVMLNLGNEIGSGSSSAIAQIKGDISGLGGGPAAYFFDITNPPASNWALVT